MRSKLIKFIFILLCIYGIGFVAVSTPKADGPTYHTSAVGLGCVNNNGTAPSITLTAPPPPGSDILVSYYGFADINANTTVTTTVTDSAGNTYTEILNKVGLDQLHAFFLEDPSNPLLIGTTIDIVRSRSYVRSTACAIAISGLDTAPFVDNDGVVSSDPTALIGLVGAAGYPLAYSQIPTFPKGAWQEVEQGGYHTVQVREAYSAGTYPTHFGTDFSGTWAGTTRTLVFRLPSSAAKNLDFGDAPDSYGTTAAASGASHVTGLSPVFLGGGVDFESDGQPSVNADGDGLDEEGILFPSIMQWGVNNLTVTSPSGGYINMWLDKDGGGNFDVQLIQDFALPAGAFGVPIDIPTTTTDGYHIIRARLTSYSTDGTGTALLNELDGEVEDYNVLITSNGVITTLDVELSAATASSIEGDSGTNASSLSLLVSGGSTFTDRTIDISLADGSATIGNNDYSQTVATVQIPAGDYSTVQTVSIPVDAFGIVGDTTVEANETLAVSLANPSSNLQIGDANGNSTTVSSATYTITNDDTLEADVSISAFNGPTETVPGETVSYSFEVSNTGPDDAPSVTVTNIIPASIVASSWSCVSTGGGTCTSSGLNIDINDTVNLPVGATVTYTVFGSVNSSATGILSTTATAIVGGGVIDPTPGNDSDTIDILLTPQADVGITKTDGVSTAFAGSTITYTITVRNYGPSDAPVVDVNDTFPASLTGVTWTCTGSGGGTCAGAGSGDISETISLPAGASVTYTANATIDSGISTVLNNTATALSGVFELEPSDNSATDTTIVTNPAGVTVTPSGDMNADEANLADTATYTVELNSTPSGNVVIDVTTDGQCTITSPFSGESGQLTLTNMTPVTVTVQALNDSVDETNPHDCVITQSINTTDTTDGNYDVLLSAGSATVNVADDDTAGISLNTAGLSTIAEEDVATTTSFTITADTLPTADVTVPVTSDAQCDLGNGAGVAVDVILPSGSTAAQTVTVTAINDTSIEAATHACAITTGDPTSGDGFYDTLLATDVADTSVDILDNDIEFTVSASVGIAEGTGVNPTATFTITPGAAIANVGGSVTYAVTDISGTTTAADFTATLPSGTLNFAQASGAQTVDIEIVADSIIEQDFTLQLAVSGQTAGANGTAITSGAPATIAIADDDAASVTIEDVSGDEDSGALTFVATLDNEVSGGFTVEISTADNTATVADNDYTAVSGQLLTFIGSAGETQTFTVTPVVDNKVEADELFDVSMANLGATSFTIDISDTAIGTITNDDTTEISINDVTQTEASGTFSFTVLLTNPGDSAITVDYATGDSTATLADSDYGTATGTLTFLAGETSQMIDVTVNDDNTVETDETFTVDLSNVSGASIADNQAIGTITNDDTTTISIEDVSVVEGNSGTTTVSFTATLNDAVAGGFTVDYSTSDGTATIVDADYVVASGTLTFAGTSGETQTFDLVVNGDTVTEPDETVTVSLSNVSNANVDVSDTAIATITNDDSSGVSVSPTTLEITEGGSGDSYDVVLISQPTANVTIALTFDNTQLTVSSSSLTFTSANWNVVQPITVTAIDEGTIDAGITTITHDATSTDANYDGTPVDSVDVNVIDNSFNLITNGSFEIAGSSNRLADGWKVKQLTTKDRRVCPLLASVPDGNCAYRFKFTDTIIINTTNVRLIKQPIKDSGVFVGDALTFSGQIKARNLVRNGKFIIKALYLNDGVLSRQKIRIKIPAGTYPYTTVTESMELTDTPFKIVVIVRGGATTGKFFVDDLSLIPSVAAPSATESRFGDVESIPLPAAPDNFRD